MHNSTIYVFFLLRSSYMFWDCRHPQGAYTKISLKHVYCKLCMAVCFNDILL